MASATAYALASEMPRSRSSASALSPFHLHTGCSWLTTFLQAGWFSAKSIKASFHQLLKLNCIFSRHIFPKPTPLAPSCPCLNTTDYPFLLHRLLSIDFLSSVIQTSITHHHKQTLASLSPFSLPHHPPFLPLELRRPSQSGLCSSKLPNATDPGLLNSPGSCKRKNLLVLFRTCH